MVSSLTCYDFSTLLGANSYYHMELIIALIALLLLFLIVNLAPLDSNQRFIIMIIAVIGILLWLGGYLG